MIRRRREVHSILALLLFSATASAQPIAVCAPHAVMAAVLLKQEQEKPVRMGINKDNNLVETYASLTGSWTDVMTNMLTGVSCITDHGRNHQGRLVPPKDQDL